MYNDHRWIKQNNMTYEELAQGVENHIQWTYNNIHKFGNRVNDYINQLKQLLAYWKSFIPKKENKKQ